MSHILFESISFFSIWLLEKRNNCHHAVYRDSTWVAVGTTLGTHFREPWLAPFSQLEVLCCVLAIVCVGESWPLCSVCAQSQIPWQIAPVTHQNYCKQEPCGGTS